MFIVIFFVFSNCLFNLVNSYVPLVIWHGMGDSCCNPLSLGKVIEEIKNENPGIYVHSLQIGSNFEEDTMNGFFLEINKQIAMACRIISNDSNLSNGYNAMGFSQGGQFLRAVAQRCPSPPMKILISVGGQHQGVYGFPRCNAEKSIICNVIRKLLDVDIYSETIQEHSVQAEYWHDSDKEEKYVAKSNFLSKINLERDSVLDKNDRENLLKLSLIVFVMFSKDTMVEPRETEWFGFYKPGNPKKIVFLNESKLYQDDRLGLKEMNMAKKLRFLSCPTDHLQFTLKWFKDNLMPFINSTYN